MRLTTRTNLAARILMACAVNPDRRLRTAEIADLCNCSTNHAAHVVQRLHAEGYLEAQRGRAGGIRLARAVPQVSIGAVFRLFESEIPFAECFDADTNSCPLVGTCRLQVSDHTIIESKADGAQPDLLVDMATLTSVSEAALVAAGLPSAWPSSSSAAPRSWRRHCPTRLGRSWSPPCSASCRRRPRSCRRNGPLWMSREPDA